MQNDNLTIDCKELSGCVSLIHDSFIVRTLASLFAQLKAHLALASCGGIANMQARTSMDLTSQIVPGEVVRVLWANGSKAGATQENILDAWHNVTNSMFLRESRDRGELFEATVTYPQDSQTLTLSGYAVLFSLTAWWPTQLIRE